MRGRRCLTEMRKDQKIPPERQGSTMKGIATPGEHTVEGSVTPWQHNEGRCNVGAAQ